MPPKHAYEDERTRYSIANPAPDRETAITTLAELTQNEASCRAQLEFTTPADFETEESFYDWKPRAMSALGHITAERKYLEQFLEGKFEATKQRPVLQLVANNNTPSIDERASIELQVSAVAYVLQEQYTTVYSERAHPTSLDTGLARIKELRALIDLHERLVLKLDERACSLKIKESEAYRSLCEPIVGIRNRIDEETRILELFVQDRRTFIDVQSTAMNLLMRVRNSSFAKTPDEIAAIELVRNFKFA
jgi:hypothetical protein